MSVPLAFLQSVAASVGTTKADIHHGILAKLLVGGGLVLSLVSSFVLSNEAYWLVTYLTG